MACRWRRTWPPRKLQTSCQRYCSCRDYENRNISTRMGRRDRERRDRVSEQSIYTLKYTESHGRCYSAIESGKILIPQIEVLPTAVVANPDLPPELEIRFDMEPSIPNFEDPTASLPTNWALRFIHNQLFKHFETASRFCPGPFHSTILRKAFFYALVSVSKSGLSGKWSKMLASFISR